MATTYQDPETKTSDETAKGAARSGTASAVAPAPSVDHGAAGETAAPAYDFEDRTHAPLAPRPRWRRRNVLIDWRFQLRMSMTTVLFVVIPLVAFNILGYMHGNATLGIVSKFAPELYDGMARQTQFWTRAVLIVSALFVAGILYLRILETHKTAGAAYRLARGLESMRDGDFSQPIRLRSGDNLGELCTLINEVSATVRQKEREEIEELIAVAAAVRDEDPDAASTLHRLAQAKRARVG